MRAAPTSRTILAAVVALVLTAASPRAARAWLGEVLRVYDGDFLIVLYNKYQAHIQLHGVDAPGKGQRLAKRARRLTKRLVSGKTVRVMPLGLEKGRILAKVYVGKRCINEELVKAGLARWDSEQAPADKRLGSLENKAKQAGRGIWAKGARATSCKSPPDPPCPRDRVCRSDRDCVLMKRSACACYPCHKSAAWSVRREARSRWRAHWSRIKQPCAMRRCAKCRRKFKVACVRGSCSFRP
jgi:endonuclease YncB( thermonuclease family)